MSKLSTATRNARKLWPVVLMGWERWQQLPPERKEHYKKQARTYADRGRKAIADRGTTTKKKRRR
jgi:TRAP-type C4-dicarboxylate transport system substrate-binding protein